MFNPVCDCIFALVYASQCPIQLSHYFIFDRYSECDVCRFLYAFADSWSCSTLSVLAMLECLFFIALSFHFVDFLLYLCRRTLLFSVFSGWYLQCNVKTTRIVFILKILLIACCFDLPKVATRGALLSILSPQTGISFSSYDVSANFLLVVGLNFWLFLSDFLQVIC